jgi:glycosyltransferase involved in cell wall biosynthesis
MVLDRLLEGHGQIVMAPRVLSRPYRLPPVTVAPGFRLAIIGTRGIPARYGGFETVAQELAPRLVERGHQVTVYGRRPAEGEPTLSEYRGVQLIHTPALHRRSLEQLSHEVTSIADSLRRKFDFYYFLGYRGAPLYVPLRLIGRPMVINTDGLEWKRRKWNRLGRAYLRVSEWLAAHVASDELVSDSLAIADYFERRHHRRSTYLPYGAYVRERGSMRMDVLERFSVEPDGYYLVAARIEPENNIDLIVREFVSAGSPRELVIVGSMNYETPYWRELQEIAAGGRVRFVGSVYGPGELDSLRLGAYGYLHGHEVGGTNPTLLEAMGCGTLPLALGTPFNRETVGSAGCFWSKKPGSLANAISWADAHPDTVDRLREQARTRIATDYTWEAAADAHDAFFRALRDGTRAEDGTLQP